MPQAIQSVSFLVVTYNSARSIGPALESILGQDYPANLIEIVAVDNASRDETPDLVRQLSQVSPNSANHSRLRFPLGSPSPKSEPLYSEAGAGGEVNNESLSSFGIKLIAQSI